MLNLFGCSNWDFFIHFFELNLRTNSKTNSNFSAVFKLDQDNVRVMNAVSAKLKASIDNMTTAAEVETLYLRAHAASESDWNMVYLIREHIGEGVTYINEAGATVEVTNAMIRKAIISMRRDALEENLEALQSPYALYLDWFAREGVGE